MQKSDEAIKNAVKWLMSKHVKYYKAKQKLF